MKKNKLIKEFENFNDLKKEIILDLNDKSNIVSNRFPVRFIFLNSHKELKDVVDILGPDVERKELSSFLYSDNDWLSEDQVINNIKKIDKTSVIIPLSEFTRFSKNIPFSMIFNALAEIENHNIKLYVPLVGVWGRFENLFLKRFSRIEEWAPIWKLSTPSKNITIYQVNFEFDDKIETCGLELISTTKEWFELWKKDNITEIISLPKPLARHFKNSLPDQTFSQKILNNPKEYLYEIFGMNVPIEYEDIDFDFWIKLLIDVSKLNKKNISLKDIIVEKLNINNIQNLTLEDYLTYYLKSNDSYNKWIIKNFFINYNVFKNSYLSTCFKSTQSLNNTNLANSIFLKIFEEKYSEEYLKDRKILLSCLNDNDIFISEQGFENSFEKISDKNYKYQLEYLTNSTSVEKEKILSLINKDTFEYIIPKLENIFPDLYYYLDWNLNFKLQWIIDYFREYNKSKILDDKSEKIFELLSEYNSPNEFYKWYYKTNIKTIDDDSYVIWIDALGAEWLPLLIYWLNKFGKDYNKKVKSFDICSVNLPSATKFNKHDNIKDEKIECLDNYIHKNHYNFPNSLLNELDLIKKIAKHIITKIDSPKISIISDHGFSYLCTKHSGSFKKYNFDNTEHEGRYFLAKDTEYTDNDDYIYTGPESGVYENEKYVVALRHLSLCNTPSHEVHGGATPEEVLVPYIIVENDDSNIEYELSQSCDKINVSKDKELFFTIYPKPINLPIVIYKNKMLVVSEENDNNYILHLDSTIEKGNQEFIVKVDNDIIGKLELKIEKGGMTMNDDFGF